MTLIALPLKSGFQNYKFVTKFCYKLVLIIIRPRGTNASQTFKKQPVHTLRHFSETSFGRITVKNNL